MDLLLAARDGVKLAASLLEPATPNGHAVLLNSGTGIPRQFYGAFARHLADRGFTVLTYDYRGLGGSDKPRDATMEQWGRVDQASMIDHLAALAPDASRAVIGHSLGGQILGLADNIGGLDAAVLICSQSGHWRHWPAGRRRLRMLALWWPADPRSHHAHGAFPRCLGRHGRSAERRGAQLGALGSIAPLRLRHARSAAQASQRGRLVSPALDELHRRSSRAFRRRRGDAALLPECCHRAPASRAARSRNRCRRSLRLLPQVDAATGLG